MIMLKITKFLDTLTCEQLQRVIAPDLDMWEGNGCAIGEYDQPCCLVQHALTPEFYWNGTGLKDLVTRQAAYEFDRKVIFLGKAPVVEAVQIYAQKRLDFLEQLTPEEQAAYTRRQTGNVQVVHS